MTLAVVTTADYDSTLPFYIPEPVNPSPRRRYAAAYAPLGLLDSWVNDLGGANPMPAAASDARPLVQLDADSRPTVTFDGTSDRMQTVGSQNFAYPTTFYLVFRPTVTTSSGTKVVLEWGGGFVSINSAGKLNVTGTGGSVTLASALVAGQTYVAALTINGTSTTLTCNGETATATITYGTATKIGVGQSGGLYFTGNLYEVIDFPVAHDANARTAEINALKSWYTAA